VSNAREPASDVINYDDFMKVDIRAGTVLEAAPHPEARKPAIKLKIDFGSEIGIKTSSAQLMVHYEPVTLVGRQVAAVVNFPPRQIGKFVFRSVDTRLPRRKWRGCPLWAGQKSPQRGALILTAPRGLKRTTAAR
jgi:tRNA-binding protein